MAPKFNSAMRIHNILEKALQQGDNTSIRHVWSNIFGTVSEDQFEQDIFIAQMIGKVGEELDNLLLQMMLTEYSPVIYRSTLNDIYRILDIRVLGNAWSEVKPNITRHLLMLIKTFSEMLPSDGYIIDERELDEIKGKLIDIRDDIIHSDLPYKIKLFLIKEVDILINAIREYPIKGSVVFVDGFKQAAGDFIENKDMINEQNDHSEKLSRFLAAIGTIWAWVRERSEDADAVMFLYNAYNLASIGIHMIATNLPK